VLTHTELQDGGRFYEVMVAGDEVIEAWVRVKPHDKRLTMRKITNDKTLRRLTAALRPHVCPTCGKERT
jgi:hypothetical protein